MASKLFFCTLSCLAVLTCAVSPKKYRKALSKRQVPGECGAFEFHCMNNHCVQLEWTCDTDNDCRDGSDELNCPTDCSGPHQFKCNNTRCIPSEYRCDGDNDCHDNTDETGCDTYECGIAEIKCSNNLCIETDYMCDGDDDCGNGWDEVQANCDNL